MLSLVGMTLRGFLLFSLYIYCCSRWSVLAQNIHKYYFADKMVWKHFLGLKHVKAELFLQSQSPGTVPQLGTDIVGWKPWMMVQDQAECQTETERHCILMHFVCCVLKWMDWEWQWGAHVLAIREAALSDFDGLLDLLVPPFVASFKTWLRVLIKNSSIGLSH